MTGTRSTADDIPAADLETRMQTASLAASLLALALMTVGFVGLLISGAAPAIPGRSAVPLFELLRIHGGSPNLLLMSTGIVLLSLLPILRVVLAMRLYVRQWNVLDACTALIVLLELLLSMRIAG